MSQGKMIGGAIGALAVLIIVAIIAHSVGSGSKQDEIDAATAQAEEQAKLVQEKDQELTTQAEALAAAEEAKSALEAAVAEKDEELKSQGEALTAAEEEKSALEAAVEEKDQELTAQAETLAAAQEQVEAHGAELEGMKAEAEQLAADLELRKNEVDSHAEAIAEKDKTLAEREEQLSARASELDEARAKLQSAESQVSSLTEQMAKLNGQVKDLGAERDALVAGLQSFLRTERESEVELGSHTWLIDDQVWVYLSYVDLENEKARITVRTADGDAHGTIMTLDEGQIKNHRYLGRICQILLREVRAGMARVGFRCPFQ